MCATLRAFSTSTASMRGQNWRWIFSASSLVSFEPLIHLVLKVLICSRMTSEMSDAPTFWRVIGSTISVPVASLMAWVISLNSLMACWSISAS